MAVVAKIIAQGRLPNSQTSIHSPSGEQIYSGVLRLYNSNSTTEVVKIWLQISGGTARQMWEISLGTKESYAISIGDIGDGDDIEASSTTADVTHWTIQGRERTA